MPPRTTDAVVLRTYPYGETSLILHLFSRECGCLRGIAKGIRRKRGALLPERGCVVNTVAYIKPTRDLHLLTELSPTRVYPETRSDLCKTALRDAGFEVVLKGIRLSESQPRIFSLLVDFLDRLEYRPQKEIFPFALWHFLVRFMDLLGFGLELDTCTICGAPLAGGGGGRLEHDRGGFTCRRCPGQGQRFLPAPVLALVTGGCCPTAASQGEISPIQMKEITRALVEYCSYHLDIHSEYHALAFLEEMLGGAGLAPAQPQTQAAARH